MEELVPIFVEGVDSGGVRPTRGRSMKRKLLRLAGLVNQNNDGCLRRILACGFEMRNLARNGRIRKARVDVSPLAVLVV